MFGIIVVVILIGGALLAILWAGTLWFQGYIYNEPAEELYWRAPAAALAISAVLAFWSFLAYRNPGTLDPLFSNPDEVVEYPRIYSVEKSKDKVVYERRRTGDLRSSLQYIRPGSRPGEGRWKRETELGLVEAIIVEEGEGPEKKEIRFELQSPPGGKFKPEEEAKYVEQGGRRIMTEGEMGRVVTPKRGMVFVYFLLNAIHLGVWFLCLWLLLRFQWPHALGLAVVFWLVMTVWIVPQLVQRAEQAVPPRDVETTRP